MSLRWGGLVGFAVVLLAQVACVRAGQVCSEGSYQCRFNNVEQCQDDFWVVQDSCSDAEICDVEEGVAACRTRS